MTKKLCLLLLCYTLIGCAPTRKVIAPIKYNDEIDLHIPKTAYIHWIPGRCVAGEKPKQTGSDYNNNHGSSKNLLASLAMMAVATAIDNQNRKNNPSEYVHEYGKADEAVFITSLRDVLNEQDVFKDTKLVTDLKETSPKDIVIKIYFKTARTNSVGDVTLTVELSISGGNKPNYQTTYLIQSDEEKPKSFIDKKTDASQQLLKEVVGGITQWNSGRKQ